jgi:hypothetical protein
VYFEIMISHWLSTEYISGGAGGGLDLSRQGNILYMSGLGKYLVLPSIPQGNVSLS